MSRGKKLNLFIGAEIDEGWAEIESKPKNQKSQETLAPNKHTLFFKKERRRGKVVTLVGEFSLSTQEATALIKKLKKKLGCGGTYKESWMEFQGETTIKLRALLVEEGFHFKPKH